MTQTDVARKLGRPQSGVSAIERGSRKVSVIELIEPGERHWGLMPRPTVGQIIKTRRRKPRRRSYQLRARTQSAAAPTKRTGPHFQTTP
jgi:transcriptional regulator with XRE-family HTH domain